MLRLRQVYPWVVITAGMSAVAGAVSTTVSSPFDYRWIVLCALTLTAAVATLRMRGARISFSISDSFTFAALLLLGPAAATIAAAVEALTISCLLSPEQRRPTRMLFNVGSVSMAVWTAGRVLALVDHLQGPGSLLVSPQWVVVATGAAITTHFLVNTWTVALAVAFDEEQSPLLTWRTHFLHLGVAYIAGGYIAILLVLFAPSFDSVAFALLAPMPLVLYLSVRTWVARVNDKVTYLDRINQQYRATIEALAHAVDAKDQVTHGHIRRVQTACLQMARALGCAEQGELHAIEAASLLHDLGKLAIPEHILNKPGRLTEGEYNRMKTHASIGADILAGIDFPYPVVPIVRHHHENWDGSGYPDGLAGQDIPLGARILAVVDCFDALTSDRPYRPAMSREQALMVLRERSGRMYDPHVVEQFIPLSESIDIAPATRPAAPRPSAIRRRQPKPGIDIHHDEPLAAFAAVVLAAAVRTLRATAGVVFRYDAAGDALEPLVSYGLPQSTIDSLHMPVGERLSGWVASNRQTQTQSDARLDLRDPTSSLHAAISVPILDREALVGVMSFYAPSQSDFASVAGETLEAFAATVANAPRHEGNGEVLPAAASS